MDINKAIETVAKLHQEKNEFHAKRIKAKKQAIVCLIIGALFLIAFIVTMVYSLNHLEFKVGTALFIVFAVLAFIFLEAAIIFFVMSKCVYGHQEETRAKILAIIDKEVNKKTTIK